MANNIDYESFEDNVIEEKHYSKFKRKKPKKSWDKMKNENYKVKGKKKYYLTKPFLFYKYDRVELFKALSR